MRSLDLGEIPAMRPGELEGIGAMGSDSDGDSATVEAGRPSDETQAASPVSRPKSLPERLGDYRIGGEIGRGGMGMVYEAEQVSLGRRVALKVLGRGMRDDVKAMERFRREARAAAQLHHTNIVPVFEVGEEGDTVFYAMQFIRGQGLNLVIDELRRMRDRGRGTIVIDGPGASMGDDRTQACSPDRMAQSLLTGRFLDESTGPPLADATIARTDAPPDAVDPSSSAVWPGGDRISVSKSSGRRQSFFGSVAEVGRQVAGGLAYAHARGIVHRDIKPANLLLDTAGVAWIADFGLAKAGDDGLTESGDILGTLRFMAPERFRGEGDGRSDIYALGATLFELLTLRAAFDSPDRLQLIEQVRNQEPPRPRSLDPAIPRDLETIVLKAMAKEPSARYATAADLAEDLRRYLAGEPIQARRTGPVERCWRWARRNPLAGSLASAVAAMMGVVVVATMISARRERAMRIEADRALDQAERTLADLREARSEESTFRRAINTERENFRRDPNNVRIQGSLDSLYSQQMNLGRLTGRTAEAVETALARRDLNVGSPGRLYQVAMDLADCLPGPDDGNRPNNPDAEEAERVAGLAIDTLGRAILAGYHSVEYNTTFALNTNVSFRPLQSRPAFRSLVHAIERDDLGRGNGEILAYHGHHSYVESIAITPDGKKALTLGGDTTAQLWDLSTGRPVFAPFPHSDQNRGVAISPDGHLGATGCNDGLVHLWDLDDGTEIGSFAGHTQPVHGVGFTPDGKTLVSAGKDGTVRIWDVASRVERFCLRGHQGEVIDVAVSHDGRLAVSTGADETVRVWDIVAGRLIHTLTGHHGRVWSVAIAPDSRMALSGAEDGALIQWDIIAGRRLRTLLGQRSSVRGIAISPDGRRALSGGPQNRLLYWDLDSGRVLHRFPGNFGGGMVGVAISPDGRFAVTGSTDGVARVWSLSEPAALARDLSLLGRWDESVAAYKRAVQDAPEDGNLLHERSLILWKLGRWSDLVFDHEIFLRQQPFNWAGRLNQARILLMAGDREGFRRACDAMRPMILEIADNNGAPIWEIPLAVSLATDSGIDPQIAARVATRAIESAPGVFGIQPVLGLAQYRAGRYNEAIDTLLAVALEHPNLSSVSTTWPMLAMAYHRLGDAAEAEIWMEKVRELRREKTPKFGRDPIRWSGPWANEWDWLDFEILAREAEATLRPPPKEGATPLQR